MEPEPEPAAAPDPSGSQIQHLVERIESFQSSRATHPSAIEPRALASPELGTTADRGAVREFSFETNIEGVIHWEIGRAPCRERVCKHVKLSGVAGSLKKKKKT